MSEYTLQRKNVDGQRFYEVTENKTSNVVGLFPSITTVLSGTSDKSSLVAWRERIGEVEADRISKLSLNRGTVMHRLIELYKLIPGTPDVKLERLKEIAAEDAEVNEFASDELGELFLEEGWLMFMKFWHNQAKFFSRVNKVIESETFLWSIKGGGYAGTVDNVSEMIDGKIVIIDYKNSREPKHEDWIDDYKIQVSAYWVAYWERSGVKPDGAEIWIASETSSIPQIFKIDNTEIRYYFKEFQERLKTFKEKFNI
jgi:hypothetical protein